MSFRIPTESSGFTFFSKTEPNSSNLVDGVTWYDLSTYRLKIWKSGSWIEIANKCINDKGVFAGGYDGSNLLNIIDYITISTLGDAKYFGDITVTRGNLSSTSNSFDDRGVFGGGYDTDYNVYNIIDYITISTPGNTQDFGDLLTAKHFVAATSNGINDRGVFGGGNTGGSNTTNTIEYITISTLGNAQDFGDLTVARAVLAATSNTTNERGVFASGLDSGNTVHNIIEYITISTLGNAQDFGDLMFNVVGMSATSNATKDRGVFAGGFDVNSTVYNVIEYITISTPGNAQDFGDLTVARADLAATSNGIDDRGVFAGGFDSGSNMHNIIDYITISTLGNAQDFGDLMLIRSYLTATSNS